MVPHCFPAVVVLWLPRAPLPPKTGGSYANARARWRNLKISKVLGHTASISTQKLWPADLLKAIRDRA